MQVVFLKTPNPAPCMDAGARVALTLSRRECFFVQHRSKSWHSGLYFIRFVTHVYEIKRMRIASVPRAISAAQFVTVFGAMEADASFS